MAEFKRNFSAAKMNRDMDERLVPNGQYREAVNIEIATSEGSDVGTVQTLLGNTKRDTLYQTTASMQAGNIGVVNYSATGARFGPHQLSTVVGSITHPTEDKIYYFVKP